MPTLRSGKTLAPLAFAPSAPLSFLSDEERRWSMALQFTWVRGPFLTRAPSLSSLLQRYCTRESWPANALLRVSRRLSLGSSVVVEWRFRGTRSVQTWRGAVISKVPCVVDYGSSVGRWPFPPVDTSVVVTRVAFAVKSVLPNVILRRVARAHVGDGVNLRFTSAS